MAEHRRFLTTDELEEGKYLKIKGNQVTYLASKIRRNITNPEERVRVEYYLELIKKYKYPDTRIQPNCKVPGRKPDIFADLVVFEDDEFKKPYIVVECKQDGISQAEIRQAIEQVFGYANSLRAKYASVVAGTVRIAFDVAGFKPSEREKNIIADIPERYGKIIKYRFKKESPENDLKVATRDELLRKFQQCHDTLWEGGKRNPAEAFDEMSKLMFCKIWDERFITKKGEYYKFQAGTHETLKEVIQRIRGIYLKAQKMEPGVFTEEIKAEDPIIYSIIELLQGISLARTELDIKGEAFEHFLGAVFRQAMGQYFTPRPIVKFMVDMLEPNEDDKVIDPACGSGGFLLYTLDSVKKHLENSLSSRDALDRWKDFALYQLFGIEINSQLARVSMMNMIIHEDGHMNIENNDALDDTSKFHPRRDIRFGKYSLLLTNPPFGAVIKMTEHNYLKEYELGAKEKPRKQQNTEILFIERCLNYLKPGGRMGIVLPDGILTNSTSQYVRNFITERAQVLAVVSLPQLAFKRPHAKGGGGTGSGVKASLLFLRKKKEGEQLSDNYPIFMSLAEHIGYDSTGRPDKNEFPDIVKAYQRFREKNRIDFFVKAPLSFGVGRGELESRLDPFYHKPGFKKLLSTPYKTDRLSNILQTIESGSRPKGGVRAIESGVPSLGGEHLNSDGMLDFSNIRFVSEDYYKKQTKGKVTYNDILIVKDGATTGKVAIIRENFPYKDCLINEHLFLVRPKLEYNSKYVSAFLFSQIGQKQIKRMISGATQGGITRNVFKKVVIPLPPRAIQDEIADMMDKAYRIKKEKEKKAKELLNSIDRYVLSELGIKLPELKEEKYYPVTFGRIKGGRLDASYYQPRYSLVIEAVKNGKYPLKTIGALSLRIVNGLDFRKFTEEGTPYIRVGNIKPNEIDESDIKFVPINLAEIKKDVKLNVGDVLLTRKGTFGISAVVERKTEYLISSEVMRLRPTTDIIYSFYFSIVNNTSIVQSQYEQEAVGAIMGSLSQGVVNNSLIPLPPLSIQQKIAQEVQSRQERAKQLKQSAKEVVNKTKEEIEKMILGTGL